MNNNLPLVSIVVASYNNGKYLEQCLESAVNQTYHHIEIIIADDYSTDNSVEICNVVINKYPNRKIVLVSNPKNIGACNSLNNAIFNYCTGVFIKILDSDDYLKLDAIQCLLNGVLPQFEFGLVYAQCTKVVDGVVSDLFGARVQLNDLLVGNNLIPALGTLFSRAAFIEVGGYPVDGYIGDLALWLKFFIKGFRVVFIEQNIGFYRVNSSGGALTSNKSKLFASKIEVLASAGRLLNQEHGFELITRGIKICLTEMMAIKIQSLIQSGFEMKACVLFCLNLNAFVRYKKRFLFSFWSVLLKLR